MAQDPGPRGSPHEPQPPGPALMPASSAPPSSPPKSSPPPKSESNESDDFSPPCAANVENSFSRSAPPHFGQAGFSFPNSSCSNRFEHLRHEYSYKGMETSGSAGRAADTLPRRAAVLPLTLHEHARAVARPDRRDPDLRQGRYAAAGAASSRGPDGSARPVRGRR